MRPRQPEWSSTIQNLIPAMIAIAVGTVVLSSFAKELKHG